MLEIKQKLKAEEVVRNLAFKNPDNVFANLMAVKINHKLKESAKVDYYLRQIEELELDKKQKKTYLEFKLLSLFGEDTYDKEEVEPVSYTHLHKRHGRHV